MDSQLSERRMTRSQTRLGPKAMDAGFSSATPLCAARPPASAGRAKVRSGRRVLAEIQGNDSPIAGLVPGTPYSNLKSAGRSRIAKLAGQEDDVSSSPSSCAESKTPVGESLLRSQVQLLLKNVTDSSDHSSMATSLISPHQVKTGFPISPSRLAAPTPMNTPSAVDLGHVSSMVTPFMPLNHLTSSRDCFLPDVPNIQEVVQVKNCASILQDPNISRNSNVMIAITESVVSGRDQHGVMKISPLVSETKALAMPHAACATLLGKQATRTLHFESPGKASSCMSTTTLVSDVPVADTTSSCLSDDEASEWSVLVNVSSPVGTHDDLLRQPEHLDATPVNEVASFVHEHVQKHREESNKVDLLWSCKRQANPYSQWREEDNDEDTEDYFAGEEETDQQGQDDEECKEEQKANREEDEECADLCKHFSGMWSGREEEDHNTCNSLPRGMGQHIRFLYDSDGEQIEEEVVAGEEVASGAVHLKGMPAPLGRHVRFRDDEDGEDQVRHPSCDSM